MAKPCFRGKSLQLHTEEDPDVFRLLDCAQNGDLNGITCLLDHKKVDVDCSLQSPGPNRGQTALIRASKYGQCESVRILLRRGANPFYEDDHFRSAFYYVFFSAQLTENQQVKLLETILSFYKETERHVGRWASQRRTHAQRMTEDLLETSSVIVAKQKEFTMTEEYLNWSKVAIQAAYCSKDQLTRLFFDELDYYIVNKDSNNIAEMEFYGFQVLDNPHAQCHWADGSSTPKGETVLHILTRKERSEILSHPSILSLLQWKWDRCMHQIVFIEMFLLIMLIFSLFSISTLITLDEKEEFHNDLLHIGEGVTSVIFFQLLAWDIHVAVLFKEFSLSLNCVWTNFAFFKIIFCTLLWGLYLTFGQIGEIQYQLDCLCIFILIIWMRLSLLSTINRQIGPFLIMVQKMVFKDVVWYLLVLCFLMPPFLVCFQILQSTSSQRVIEGDMFSMLLTGLGFGEGIQMGDFGDFMATSILIMFLILVPLLAVNLLIAMMNDTYSKIQDEKKQAWALSFARIACKSERIYQWLYPVICSSSPFFAFSSSFHFSSYFLKYGVLILLLPLCLFLKFFLRKKCFCFSSATFVDPGRKFEKCYKLKGNSNDYFWNQTVPEVVECEESNLRLEVQNLTQQIVKLQESHLQLQETLQTLLSRL